jgi:membrane associated rhomboid family serine protease/Zn-finger nucleic acid-binding protein
MLCPGCQSALRPAHSGNLEIDVCPRCGGSFFDRDEFKAVLDQLLTAREVPEAPLELRQGPAPVRLLDEPFRSCPRCGGRMAKFNYCYDSNIILDRCEQCGGVWADRGEVLKCAQYRKGNPKLDRLAGSIADNARRQQAWRDAAEAGAQFSRQVPYPSFAWYFLPSLIPLGDDNPSERLPVVTIGLIAANVLVLFLVMLVYGFDLSRWQHLYMVLGLAPAQVWAGQFWGLFTHMFLHAGIFHLAGNMLFLWVFGDNVEDAFGRPRFLGFYLACGVAAGLAHVLVSPASQLPCVGASGAISGVLAAYLVFYPQAYIRTLIVGFVIEVPAAAYIGIWVAFQVLFAVSYRALALASGVAWFAHLGGFAAGLLLALAWRRGHKARPAVGQ